MILLSGTYCLRYTKRWEIQKVYKSSIEWVGYFQGISSDKSLMHQRRERNKGCILETSERKKKLIIVNKQRHKLY